MVVRELYGGKQRHIHQQQQQCNSMSEPFAQETIPSCAQARENFAEQVPEATAAQGERCEESRD